MPRHFTRRRLPTVNVRPLNDDVRRLIKHPSGQGFTDKPEGTPWPADSFTSRRIRDGDIEVVPVKEGDQPNVPEPTSELPTPSEVKADPKHEPKAKK